MSAEDLYTWQNLLLKYQSNTKTQEMYQNAIGVIRRMLSLCTLHLKIDKIKELITFRVVMYSADSTTSIMFEAFWYEVSQAVQRKIPTFSTGSPHS